MSDRPDDPTAPRPGDAPRARSRWSLIPDSVGRWLKGEPAEEAAPAPTAGPSADPALPYQPGVEWTPPGQAPASCPVCGTPFPDPYDASGEQVCATCGAARPGPTPTLDHGPALDPDEALLPPRPCVACGGPVDPDGYCTVCGAKAESERDHYREEPAPWVAAVCDRGVRHHRNEDAVALAADQSSGRAVLVVCDGVSTSEHSDVASLAGAQAARDLLWERVSGGADDLVADLAQAVATANEAVVSSSDLASENSASATFVAVAVTPATVWVANLGDSRAYWVGDDGTAELLTVDDSMAQARIDMGVDRREAETSPGAHAITKWLGRDAPDLAPRVVSVEVPGDGWVVVCSDGLWNYASAAADLAAVVRAAVDAEPRPAGLVEACEAVVAWANEQGGQDNVTVALARLGTPVVFAPVSPEVDTTADGPDVTAPAPDEDRTAAPPDDLSPAGPPAQTTPAPHDPAPAWENPAQPDPAQQTEPPPGPTAPTFEQPPAPHRPWPGPGEDAPTEQRPDVVVQPWPGLDQGDPVAEPTPGAPSPGSPPRGSLPQGSPPPPPAPDPQPAPANPQPAPHPQPAQERPGDETWSATAPAQTRLAPFPGRESPGGYGRTDQQGPDAAAPGQQP